ncbi:MAG: hypothetical protein ACI814_003503, partial [Mariniblastus sp.]
HVDLFEFLRRGGLPFLRGDEVQFFRFAKNDYSKTFSSGRPRPPEKRLRHKSVQLQNA